MTNTEKQKSTNKSQDANNIKRRTIKCMLGLPMIVLVSCTNAGNNTQTNQEQHKNTNNNNNNNNNVVKVLNRVACKKESPSCNQTQIDMIWQLCLNDGYVISMPDAQIMSSRDTKELVQGTVSVTETRTPIAETTDGNGIVNETRMDPRQETVNKDINGYCIGSEYIIQSN